MLTALAAVLIGFLILVWSADLFVAGAAAAARNLGMPPILIGLTIVSLGTSAPEVLVSINAAIDGTGELAIGNAIGSNITNIGLVLGTTALIVPLYVQRSRLKRELPVLLLVMLVCWLMMQDGTLGRWDGVLMVGALTVILWVLVRYRSQVPDLVAERKAATLPEMPPARAWASFGLGLVLLSASAKLLVWGASQTAAALGVSPLVIGLTVVAVGTSLPELAASLACALKGQGEMALGGVIGSNLFNLLGVMSIPSLFRAQELAPEVLDRDYLAMGILTLVLAAWLYASWLRQRWAAVAAWLHAGWLRLHPTAVAPDSHPIDHSIDHPGGNRQHRIGRRLGVVLLALYGLYYYWLFQTAGLGGG